MISPQVCEQATSQARTPSPGATSSGLIRLSVEGPWELKNETVSMSEAVPPTVNSTPSALVVVNRVSPEDDAPTARTFLPMAGLPTVHAVVFSSPALPAAKISRCSGFFQVHKMLRGFEVGRRRGRTNRETGSIARSKTNCCMEKIRRSDEYCGADTGCGDTNQSSQDHTHSNQHGILRLEMMRLRTTEEHLPALYVSVSK